MNKIAIINASLACADEAIKAGSKYANFNSAHEGFAILKEEVDELWREVTKKDRDRESMMKEAVQVGAMALRFIADLGGLDKDPQK